jgi:hypothetical protein
MIRPRRELDVVTSTSSRRRLDVTWRLDVARLLLTGARKCITLCGMLSARAERLAAGGIPLEAVDIDFVYVGSAQNFFFL